MTEARASHDNLNGLSDQECQIRAKRLDRLAEWFFERQRLPNYPIKYSRLPSPDGNHARLCLEHNQIEMCLMYDPTDSWTQEQILLEELFHYWQNQTYPEGEMREARLQAANMGIWRVFHWMETEARSFARSAYQDWIDSEKSTMS